MDWTNYWWNVSDYNTPDRDQGMGRKVLLHDTTLRDGEQLAGVVFNEHDKVRIGLALNEYGAHRIEIMPSVSDDDFRAAKTLTGMKLKSEIVGFCRSVREDIDRCLEAGIKAIVQEIWTHPNFLGVLGWSIDDATSKMINVSNYAKKNGMHITAFFPHSTQLDPDYFRHILTKVTSEGSVDAIGLADTFGVCSPEGTYRLVKKVREFTDLPLGIHPHNTLGLGTANALAGVRAGAEVVYTCVNGLGEGSGNTPLEEVALNLRLLMGIDVGVKYEKTVELCRLVESLSNLPLFANKPLAGSRVFATEAGMVIPMETKLIERGGMDLSKILATVVGSKREFVIGKKSGKASIEYKVNQLGLPPVPGEMALKILEMVKKRSIEQKASISDQEFRKIVQECTKPI